MGEGERGREGENAFRVLGEEDVVFWFIQPREKINATARYHITIVELVTASELEKTLDWIDRPVDEFLRLQHDH